MSQSLVAGLAWIGGVVIVLVDGRRSTVVAALIAGLVLAPAAGSVGGAPAVVLLAGGGTAVGAAGLLGRLVGGRLGLGAGLDPDVPVTATGGRLFGPRSIRLLAGALALPAASWVSLNVEVGGAAVAGGAIFAAADLWLVGAVRLLRARTLDDLAVGAEVVALASATAWLLQAGPGAEPEALTAIAGAAIVAAVTGTALGRRALDRRGAAA